MFSGFCEDALGMRTPARPLCRQAYEVLESAQDNMLRLVRDRHPATYAL